MKSINLNLIELNEIEDVLRLVEAQRDLVYHLTKFKDALAERNKELELISQKAQLVQKLKVRLKASKRQLMTLSEEQRKKINNLLQARHIKI